MAGKDDQEMTRNKAEAALTAMLGQDQAEALKPALAGLGVAETVYLAEAVDEAQHGVPQSQWHRGQRRAWARAKRIAGNAFVSIGDIDNDQ
jgi:hypothetical protein